MITTAEIENQRLGWKLIRLHECNQFLSSLTSLSSWFYGIYVNIRWEDQKKKTTLSVWDGLHDFLNRKKKKINLKNNRFCLGGKSGGRQRCIGSKEGKKWFRKRWREEDEVRTTNLSFIFPLNREKIRGINEILISWVLVCLCGIVHIITVCHVIHI